MTKVHLTTLHLWSDWTTVEQQEVDIDKYFAFEIELRQNSWYLIGFYKKDDIIEKDFNVLHNEWYRIRKEFYLLKDKIVKISTNNNNFDFKRLIDFFNTIDIEKS